MYLALKDICISLADRIRADLHIVFMRLGCKSFLSFLILFLLLFFFHPGIYSCDPQGSQGVIGATSEKTRGKRLAWTARRRSERPFIRTHQKRGICIYAFIARQHAKQDCVPAIVKTPKNHLFFSSSLATDIIFLQFSFCLRNHNLSLLRSRSLSRHATVLPTEERCVTRQRTAA